MDQVKIERLIDLLNLMETLKVKGIISRDEWLAVKAKIQVKIQDEVNNAEI